MNEQTMSDEATKRCSRCRLLKSHREFSPQGKSFKSACRACARAAWAQKRAAGFVRPKSDTMNNIWRGMIARCHNPKNAAYSAYGGRGIRVCDRWLGSFTLFCADVGRRPSPEYSLDRYPDRNGNYEPGNVRWATWSEQQNNRRDNRRIEHGGLSLTLAQWERRLGLGSGTMAMRLAAGDSGDELFRPSRNGRKLTINGTTKLLQEWADEAGLHRATLASRIDELGWPPEKAISFPPKNCGQGQRI